MKIIINGKVYSKKYISGVQRYQLEIVRELDKLIKSEEIEMIVPKDAQIPKLKNIKVKRFGHFKNILWEQVELPYYVYKNKGISLNLGNVAPIISPGIVCLHDINMIKNRKNFNYLNYLWYKILHRNTAKRTKQLLTVSEFSKNEIVNYYNINRDKVHITYNGWQHLTRVEENQLILDKIRELTKGKEYFFSIGTLTKHKNLKWVIEVAKKNPEYIFLISGFKNSKKVYKKLGIESTSNVKYIGYLTDEEMKTVMKNAKALVYPTLYEGFGIPVIEAIALNTKVIVSYIPAIREIYGDSVYYINPYDTNIKIEELLKKNIEDPKIVLEKYSWEKSAKKLLKILRKYM